MPEEELTEESLEQVGTLNFVQLNDFMTAYEQGDMQRVVELGQALLANPAYDMSQKEEISKMINQAQQSLNAKEETKGFGM